MTIEEKDFRLIPIGEGSSMFDVELLHTVKPRGGEPREEFQNVAYGLPIDSAIQRIANYRIQKRHENEAITLQQYLTEYREIISEIKKLCVKD